jgi:hypothetical protein
VGLNPFWQEDFFLTLQDFWHQAVIINAEPHFIINCNDQFFIHLVPLSNKFTPNELLALQAEFQLKDQLLIHLWEDVWLSRRSQVLSRIHSFLGMNKSIHGRKAKVAVLNQKQISLFLDNEHLQGAVKAKYSYGLTLDEELIAVASFSMPRVMKTKGKNYLSAELVRFASKSGYTVVGGLSKLIKHFTKQTRLNDLMTYADRDWSLGKGYKKLGFDLSNTTPGAYLYVAQETLARYFEHRLPKELLLAFEQQNNLNLDDFLVLNGFNKVFNTGNLKYHLYL